jgi:type I restriction enzyme S subunit
VIPWVSLADVWQLRSGETVYLEDTAEMISPVGMANSSARLLPKGTVILSRTASVGFAAIMATDMATTQDFAAWVPGPKVRSKFLYYVLRAMRSEFRRLMMGSTHQTIYMPDIRSFRTPLPPLAEQDRIIAALDASIGRYRQATAKIQASITRLREYRAALITAAVTGQIDVSSLARPTEPARNRASAGVLPLRPMAMPDRRAVRVLVAADVVHRLGADPYLGRTKLQKLMFLAEAHANINDIAGRYQRYRYGPYDDAMVQEIELGLRQDGYYDTRVGTGVDREKVAFLQMSRAGGHRDALAAALGGKTDTLRQLVDLFKGKDTEATEAVATLYAVWNDALIDGKQPDDAAIIRGFLQDWHPEKGKFKRADLQTWLGWMRRHGLVPKGTGPRTISTNTPSLFEQE